MAKRRIANIVIETTGCRYHLNMRHTCVAANDLLDNLRGNILGYTRHLERMKQSRSDRVIRLQWKDLRLVTKPSERRRIYSPTVVTFELTSGLSLNPNGRFSTSELAHPSRREKLFPLQFLTETSHPSPPAYLNSLKL